MTHFKPMDLIQFKRLVKAEGYKLVSTKKHYAILTMDDERVMIFAVAHSKDSKKYVKPYYIKEFYRLIHKD